MTLKNNRAPLLSNIKLYASFHHHMWIHWSYSPETVKMGCDLCDLDLWPWPFAWTLLWSLVITPENFMMIRWWEHSQKGVTDRRTDGQTENTICRAAWSQLKITHDDIIKWKHFPCYWPFVGGIHQSLVNSPHKGQWCGALMFSLICAWINGWINNHEAGHLRCHHAHYDAIVMMKW